MVYSKPSVISLGNSMDITKGCGGWGCEMYFNNMSYEYKNGYCQDIHWGEWGDC